jgi:hypothetical protein
MKVLGCRDWMDRALRCTARGKSNRKVAVRKFRQQVRTKLKAGDYDHVPVAVRRDYND